MITSIIELVLKASVPLIDYFVKNADRNRELKEKMFKMIERQSKSIEKTITLKHEFDEMKNKAKGNSNESKD